MSPTVADGVDADERLLAPLLERLAASAEGRPDLLEAFARAAYRRVAPQRLRQLDLDAAVAQLSGALAFVDERPPGTLALRVFNPTVDEHGWAADGTVVEINIEDGPFLLSTVTEELDRLGLDVAETVHPVMGVERDERGRIAKLGAARRAPDRESWIHLELATRLADDRLDALADDLRGVLSDARAATRDFAAMKEAVAEVVFQLRASGGSRYSLEEVDEATALLAWLLDDHFILLGSREYDLLGEADERVAVVRAGSGLGILGNESSSSYATPVPLAKVRPRLRDRMESGDLLVVSRTNRPSTVHRQERMIYVGVRKVSGEGEITGEHRFLGLFAQKAYAEPASAIPILRRKLRTILEREDVVDHSHDERKLRTLFESFPKHELFSADVEDLRRTLVQLLEIQRGQDVRLLCRVDAQRRSAAALVAIPRGRFNGSIRRRVQALLTEHFGATGVDYHLSISDRDQALMHFVLHAEEGTLPDVAVDELERQIAALTRTWEDELRDALVAAHGEAVGGRLARTWAGRFPVNYAEVTSAEACVGDIAELGRLEQAASSDGDRVHMALHRGPDRHSAPHRFKLYQMDTGVELSAFLPVLESLGLVVVDEYPSRIAAPWGEVHLHDFGVRVVGDVAVEAEAARRVADAARAIRSRRAEADSLNRLVLRAGLPWDDVAVLRAYRRYRLQVGTSFTEPYQNDALVEHPQVARALTELFAARFDPDAAGDAEDGQVAARQRVLDGCDAVARLDVDRILRGFLGLIDATLRTNRYVQPARPWLSLKIASGEVPGMPKPVPYVEVFVYSPQMEGVHLRGGPVARGGLRWSDRLEDYRTEVLGLMKAQMVKNAVIVPTGSKGGFVLKHAPSGADEVRAEVRGQYEVFIRGLLDITDNIVAGEVVPPQRVRRADADDPYLVVAADRGTATFSDLANEISEEYGYWLADAFASGGSRGYDHKEMGITARGAWVAVQRHFRELDIDVQTEPITVVGIGDMSGDVFGNGMLRSRTIRLLAAFDHRHVFLDPDPDPEAAFAERERLYHLERSSWDDYDRERISRGGGVWSRTVKDVPVSEEVRRALRIEQESLSPPDLIRALLAAPVDLLFAGGIGTFVKSSQESHADVGDRANDAIRVNADKLGARVIGEGGNLALTQRGRIQYARRGGRINTDAIDNSAGVDTSDHEVNLKILLSIAGDEKALDDAGRDALLEEMTDDVAAQVLRDIYLQTWAISQELADAPGGMEAYEAFMRDLGEAGRLDREVEVLPTTAEMDRRREAGAGFTRPELAVLLGYAKVDLVNRVLASELPDQPLLQQRLRAYFPEAVTEPFEALLERHRLRRELIATELANDLVNRMGVTYVTRTAHELGCMAYEVAAAYEAARLVTGADALWRLVGALDGRVEPTAQLACKHEVDWVVDACVRSYLHEVGAEPQAPPSEGAADRPVAGVDVAATVERDRPAFVELEAALEDATPSSRRRARRARAERLAEAGVDAELAERLAGLAELVVVPDVTDVARRSDRKVGAVGDVFFRLSEALPLDVLHARIERVEPSGHWERRQHRGLVDDLRDLRRGAALQALREAPGADADETVQRFLARRAPARERVAEVIRLLEREPEAAFAAVAVAVRALREALASGRQDRWSIGT